METNQNQNIDFSEYTVKPQTEIAPPPDLERSEKKKKIQIVIIVVCLMLTAAIWGYYFYQQNAKNQTVNYDVSGEMIP
jgi:uncharacterized protein HemX